ncbi:AAA family ATPase [Pseudomonas syringae]|uniref:AAA family ATPase n=1 Tax=Pseudomonas syringae TaxID=317 RepID=UPI000E30BD55|nr:AAA family ATPase [Pseudomonas syringae]
MLLRFQAKNVHDHLDFNISFNQDVNFIAGLNGAGKTTALNMMVSMLKAWMEELAELSFSEATLTLTVSEKLSFDIVAKQAGDVLELSVSTLPNETLITSLQEFRGSQERVSAQKFRSNKVFGFISSLSPPMFLSLDRRFIKAASPIDLVTLSHFWVQEKQKKPNLDSGMEEALQLIAKKSSKVKDSQVLEDKKLRDRIILDSFHIASESSGASLPKSNTPRDLKLKQKTIKAALLALEFKSDDFEQMYDSFFDNLISLSKSVYEVFDKPNSDAAKSSATSRKKGVSAIPTAAKLDVLSLESSKILGKWFSNSHQMARIDRLLKMIEEYEQAKTTISNDLAKLEHLINLFLKQTSKHIEITSGGEVSISISGTERPLTILSSGERQILIMLTHLCLNDLLPQSGIFIVDEPELSLHISWQDMFLEAVQAAGPDLQIILATHSPAIIGGRNSFYVPLNGGI